MAKMFRYASSFDKNISLWDTRTVADMHRIFSEAYAFNQNINS